MMFSSNLRCIENITVGLKTHRTTWVSRGGGALASQLFVFVLSFHPLLYVVSVVLTLTPQSRFMSVAFMPQAAC